jgi:hypothetical protein
VVAALTQALAPYAPDARIHGGDKFELWVYQFDMGTNTMTWKSKKVFVGLRAPKTGAPIFEGNTALRVKQPTFNINSVQRHRIPYALVVPDQDTSESFGALDMVPDGADTGSPGPTSLSEFPYSLQASLSQQKGSTSGEAIYLKLRLRRALGAGGIPRYDYLTNFYVHCCGNERLHAMTGLPLKYDAGDRATFSSVESGQSIWVSSIPLPADRGHPGDGRIVVTAAASRAFKARINTGQNHGMTFECSADLANSLFIDESVAAANVDEPDLDAGDFVIDGTEASLPGEEEAADALNNALLKYPAGDVDHAWESVLGARLPMKATPLGHPRGTQNLNPANTNGNNGTATCSQFCDRKKEVCTAAAFQAAGETAFIPKTCDARYPLDAPDRRTTAGIVRCFCVPKQNDNNHAVFWAHGWADGSASSYKPPEVVMVKDTNRLSIIYELDNRSSDGKPDNGEKTNHEVFMEAPLLTKALLLEAHAQGIAKVGWEFVPYATNADGVGNNIELRIGLLPTPQPSHLADSLHGTNSKILVGEVYRPRFLVTHTQPSSGEETPLYVLRRGTARHKQCPRLTIMRVHIWTSLAQH